MLAFGHEILRINALKNLAQLVERKISNLDATGSNPVIRVYRHNGEQGTLIPPKSSGLCLNGLT